MPMAQRFPNRAPTVLVVENEAIIRRELVCQLIEAGISVLEASNAAEAISMLDARPDIDVLVTDIQMPGSMDGLRLAHHVHDRWPPLKIVVLSGRRDTQIAELPQDSLFIEKPYRPEAVISALAQVMGGATPGPRLSLRA